LHAKGTLDGMDMSTLLDHPYAVLGPLVVVEGPAATVTAGSLVGAGLAGFWPILAIVVGADLVADTFLYAVGRAGRHGRVAPWLGRLGLTDERRGRFTAAVKRSVPRVIISAKIADLLAVPAFLSAGLARVPYRRFLPWLAAASAARAVVLLLVGMLLGARLTGLLELPGGVFLLSLVVAVPVFAVNLLLRRRAARLAP
jgi:membrane protein DedA with SNARE-associated domain